MLLKLALAIGKHFPVQAQVTVDGNTIKFDMDNHSSSILEKAFQQGADLPFSCKGGVCCTCKAKLTEGEVEMDVNYALEEDEVAAGYILTCQARPKTKKVSVDFDA